jgi:hypothetical protein
MKHNICGGLLILSLLGVFAAVGWLEADAITCGQAVIISGVSLAGMALFGYIGGYMGPYYPLKKKKSPARRQPCKAKSRKSSLNELYR